MQTENIQEWNEMKSKNRYFFGLFVPIRSNDNNVDKIFIIAFRFRFLLWFSIPGAE